MDLQKNSATQDTVDYYYKELADSISAKYNQVHNYMQSSFDGLKSHIFSLKFGTNQLLVR